MSEWISVSDRLPEPLEPVWLYGQHENGRLFVCKGYFFRDGRCVTEHGLDVELHPVLNHITHWAPMPEAAP